MASGIDHLAAPQTSREFQEQLVELRRAPHSAPDVKLQRFSPTASRRTASDPVSSLRPPAAPVSLASLIRLKAQAHPIESLNVSRASAVLPAQGSNARSKQHRLSPPVAKSSRWKAAWRRALLPPSLRRFVAAPFKAVTARPTTASRANISGAAGSSLETTTRTPSSTTLPGGQLWREQSDTDPDASRRSEAYPSQSVNRLELSSESHSTLLPKENPDSLFRRILRLTRNALRLGPVPLRPSPMRDSDTETGTSSYLASQSCGTSIPDNQADAKRKRKGLLVNAAFLSLFAFAASILCTTAILTFNDALQATKTGPGMTNFQTVVPPEGIMDDALPPKPAAVPPEEYLRPREDGAKFTGNYQVTVTGAPTLDNIGDTTTEAD